MVMVLGAPGGHVPWWGTQLGLGVTYLCWEQNGCSWDLTVPRDVTGGDMAICLTPSRRSSSESLSLCVPSLYLPPSIISALWPGDSWVWRLPDVSGVPLC